MTGLYMGHRLDTVGTEGPAQILLTIFQMALLVPTVSFQAQVYSSKLLEESCHSLVFLLPAGLPVPGTNFLEFFGLIPYEDQAEVFSPCIKKKNECFVQP